MKQEHCLQCKTFAATLQVTKWHPAEAPFLLSTKVLKELSGLSSVGNTSYTCTPIMEEFDPFHIFLSTLGLGTLRLRLKKRPENNERRQEYHQSTTRRMERKRHRSLYRIYENNSGLQIYPLLYTVEDHGRWEGTARAINQTVGRDFTNEYLFHGLPPATTS